MAVGVKVQMSRVKDTKNTVQFKEDEEDRAKQKIGTLYIPKHTLEKAKKADAENITVSVSFEE